MIRGEQTFHMTVHPCNLYNVKFIVVIHYASKFDICTAELSHLNQITQVKFKSEEINRQADVVQCCPVYLLYRQEQHKNLHCILYILKGLGTQGSFCMLKTQLSLVIRHHIGK